MYVVLLVGAVLFAVVNLAEQWCPDCSRPCQGVAAGGICPCCEEIITIEELTKDADMS